MRGFRSFASHQSLQPHPNHMGRGMKQPFIVVGLQPVCALRLHISVPLRFTSICNLRAPY